MKMNKAELEFLSLLGRFFTDYLPISMNASPNTIKSYKCAFRLLFHYLNDIAKIDAARITFETLDFDMLASFFDWLAVDRKNSRTTAKIRHGALSSFAEYAQNRNLEAGYVFRSSLEKICKNLSGA
jgi:site-specific recombinase XerD